MMTLFGNYAATFTLLSIVIIIVGYIFIRSNVGILVSVIGIALISFTMLSSGEKSANEEWEYKMLKAQATIFELQNKTPEVSVKILTAYVDKIRYVDRVKVQKVKEFVTVENDAVCTINNGFVRLHDASTTNNIIDPVTTDAEASTAKLSDIAEVTKNNYHQYHSLKTQNDSLKQWIIEQEKLWEDYRLQSR